MSNLELNKGDNFIFGVDVSGSMQTTDCPGGLSRIAYLKEKVITFAVEASKYDSDGIDVLTFGHRVSHFLGIDGQKANDIVSKLEANEGATMTHKLIEEAYSLHQHGNYEQTVLFIATDGAPSDPDAVKTAIRKIAGAIGNEHEFAISFLTVGHVDPSLQNFLDSLDDLPAAKHDIVDVKKLDEVDFLTAFVDALHD